MEGKVNQNFHWKLARFFQWRNSNSKYLSILESVKLLTEASWTGTNRDRKRKSLRENWKIMRKIWKLLTRSKTIFPRAHRSDEKWKSSAEICPVAESGKKSNALEKKKPQIDRHDDAACHSSMNSLVILKKEEKLTNDDDDVKREQFEPSTSPYISIFPRIPPMVHELFLPSLV